MNMDTNRKCTNMTKRTYCEPKFKIVEFVVELGQTLSSNASEANRGFELMSENENGRLFGTAFE